MINTVDQPLKVWLSPDGTIQFDECPRVLRRVEHHQHITTLPLWIVLSLQGQRDLAIQDCFLEQKVDDPRHIDVVNDDRMQLSELRLLTHCSTFGLQHFFYRLVI